MDPLLLGCRRWDEVSASGRVRMGTLEIVASAARSDVIYWCCAAEGREEGCMSLEAEFAEAQEQVKQLPRRPGNEDLLGLYSLFKQATVGDASGKRPGLLDPVGRAKHDAWTARKGMDRGAAMQAYVDLVQRLKKKAG